jgi:hypothetical protein
VVERRFGLHGYEHSTLERVAQELGVTRERVRQIQMDALRRLRDILEKDGFSVDAFFKYRGGETRGPLWIGHAKCRVDRARAR